MSTEFELFPGKSLSGLFKDIYDNQQNKRARISELIAEMKKIIRHAGDMAVIGPIIKDLVDVYEECFDGFYISDDKNEFSF